MKTKLTTIAITLLGVAIFSVAYLNWNEGKAKPTLGSEKYEGLVILEIEDMNSKMYEEVQLAIQKNNKLNLEYGCTENNIIVVKFIETNFSTEADNAKLIENQISKAVGTSTINRVFVKVRAFAGSSKC